MNQQDVALSVDIRQLEQENRRLNEKIFLLESIIAQFPGHVYWMDRNLTFQGCNIQQAKSLGFTDPKEIIGLQNADLSCGPQSPQLDALNADVVKTGQIWQKEEFAVFVTGPGHFLSQKMPLRNAADEIVGLLGISLDITRLKQIEDELELEKQAAEAANHAKAEFIMNISHDIRTPFTGILAIAEILLNKEKGPEKRNLLRMIYDSGKNLLDLLNSVITVISQESTKTETERKVFDLIATVERCAETFRGEITRRSLYMNLQLAPDLPRYVVGDQEKLDRVLLNLVGNAVKFTHRGGVTLQALCEQKTNDTAVIILKITDTGIGIPQDKLHDIFEKFHRVESSFTSKYEGTGLGLWLVHQFMQQLNGTVKVESRLGEGTTFICEIPMPYVENVVSWSAVEHQQLSQQSSRLPMLVKPAQILLVEDEPIAQIAEQLILHDAFNAVVTTVSTVAEAKAAVMKCKYDLLVLDIGLPDGTGDEVVRFAREQESPNRDSVIIGLSAHINDKTSADFEKYFDRIILKPLSYQECKRIFV